MITIDKKLLSILILITLALSTFTFLNNNKPALAQVIPDDDSVTTAKIKDGEVKSPDIADDVISRQHIVDGEVMSPEIADNAIGESKIVDDSVTTAKIKDGEVKSPDIADGEVMSPEIADNSVTGLDLKNDDLTADDLMGVGKLIFAQCTVPSSALLLPSTTRPSTSWPYRVMGCSVPGAAFGNGVIANLNDGPITLHYARAHDGIVYLIVSNPHPIDITLQANLVKVSIIVFHPGD